MGIIKSFKRKLVPTGTPRKASGEILLSSKKIEDLINQYKDRLSDKDENHVWCFCAGNKSQDFRGNPKYLFAYVQKYRPDIFAYWFCEDEETIETIQKLGFPVVNSDSPEAHYLFSITGVIVTEQVKVFIPHELKRAKYVNLWHGVGFKHIERKLLSGTIALPIAKKYVRNNAYYRNYQLLCVTSPMIKKEFMVDCGVDSDHLLQCGYVRNTYQKYFDPIVSFDHELRKIKGLSEDTELAVYAPTYRAVHGDTFAEAVQDIEALYECCKRNNILLIFKVHPYMEEEASFLEASFKYKDRPYFWFWDNKNDFYEIINQIDLAIVDYSSIISDMVEVGIPHYIRYVYDLDEYAVEEVSHSKEDFLERTTGEICTSFDELLSAIDHYREHDDSEGIKRIHDLFWQYSRGKEDFDYIVEQVLSFEVKEKALPTLYSFDIFDTLISRKVLAPEGVFYAVKERMEDVGGYPIDLVRNYPSFRMACEGNVREYYRKTQNDRNSDHIEIQLNEIFVRMQSLFSLDDNQTQQLMEWEIEEEIDNSIPLHRQIDHLKTLKEKGEQIVLISDMYLSTEIVTKLLKKADPVLADLPLFLSSAYGVQKTTQKLFFEVYKSFSPYYDFEKWVHYGDNELADRKRAREFGIEAKQVFRPSFGSLQEELAEEIGTKDAFLVAAMQARLMEKYLSEQEKFVVSFIALCMVPYMDWVLADAVQRNYDTLYFVSRDGHHLKRIADAIIEKKHLAVKTKYIYASRRTWRIPSFIDEVESSFWGDYGNFTDIQSEDKLYKALDLDENQFKALFPQIELSDESFKNKEERQKIVDTARVSEEYNTYLLHKAAEERTLTCGYLKQEIATNERFAMVEYWGRGHAQECFMRLWHHINGQKVDTPFYYLRSILPTQGNAIRHNFSSSTTSLLFMESIFANMPYKSIENYAQTEDGIKPIIQEIEYDKVLFDAMQRILPVFAGEYAELELKDNKTTDRLVQEFALRYFEKHRDDVEFARQIGGLMDSVAPYGKKRQFAPPYTMDVLDKFEEKELTRGQGIITSSITMSVVRSDPEVQKRYRDMYQILPGDDIAGGTLLTELRQEKNKVYRNKYKNLIVESAEFQEAYDKCVKQSGVEEKVVFIGTKSALKDQGLGWLHHKLVEQGIFATEKVMLNDGENEILQIAEKIASAKFVVMQETIPLLCKIKRRKDSDFIIIPKQPVSFIQKGLLLQHSLKWQQKYHQLASINDINWIQASSEKTRELMLRSFAADVSGVKASMGNCLTDSYFDHEFIAEAKSKLASEHPQTIKRRTILYMPQLRPEKQDGTWANMLDLHVLQQLLGDQYYVIVHLNQKQKKTGNYDNPIAIQGFSEEASKRVSLRQLMVACDYIVGDYRDTFFESALLHKPAYATAGDYQTMVTDPNVIDGFFESGHYDFCPVVYNSRELAYEIKNSDSYDFSPMEEFRNTMLGGCDGNSTERLIKDMIAHSRGEGFGD